MSEQLVPAAIALIALTPEERRTLGGFIRDLVEPSTRHLGEVFASLLRIYLLPSVLRAARKAQDKIIASGIPRRAVPLKLLVPLLEGASIEEDEDLIAAWGGLLASAATTGVTRAGFVDILRQLSPQEARILNFIYEHATQKQMIHFGVDRKRLQEHVGVANEDFLLYLQNLDRLGTIMNLGTTGMDAPGGRGWGSVVYVGLSALGLAFVQACRGPARAVVEHDPK